MRAWKRFGDAGGSLLAGGIAYSALFSIAAAVALLVTVVVAIAGRGAQSQVADAINGVLPGVVATDGQDGLIDVAAMAQSWVTPLAGVLAVGGLLMSARGGVAALRGGLRAILGSPSASAVRTTVSDVASLVVVGVVVLISSLLTTAAAALADVLLAAADWSAGSASVVRVAGAVVGLLADTVAVVVTFRLLGGSRHRLSSQLRAAAVAAVALGAVRQLGTSAVTASVTTNAVLGSFATVVTVLVWVNLMARIVLLAAAWLAEGTTTGRPRDGSVAVARAGAATAAGHGRAGASSAPRVRRPRAAARARRTPSWRRRRR